MTCPNCEHENQAGAKFCEECGAPLARTCPNCGSQASATSKFCPECAHPLVAPSGDPRFASPKSYTPHHLAQKILTSRAALEGERKLITVLFADVKGSTELLAERDPDDPEAARRLLDPVLEHMMEAVHRYEGTVNQVVGDGIMALFGAPLAHEDHAVRASYAALRMQEAIRRYSEEVRRSQGIEVQIRVGLNSGDVLVRTIGSDLRMDYTADGLTTHLAARMEQLADPGTILLTPTTFNLAEGYVEAKSRGPVPVKGLTEPMEVFELIGIGAIRSRLQAAAVRGLTRLTGRENETGQLRLALERAALGHGQVVSVVGEPGVGKSRLCWEFIHSSHTQSWLILESRSVSYGKATPYLPVIDLLKAYFQIEGRDDTGAMREKVNAKILSLDRQLESSLPALLSLLDVPVQDAAWEQLTPAQRRRQTLDGVKHLLLRVSRVQPLVVMVEDLHWIDSETQALLDSFVESLPTSRLLLLVNYRPEYQHGWADKTYHGQVRIDPLEAASAEDLLTTLLGTDNNLDPLKRVLIKRTQGNPLFLEESVRSLVETRAITGERGAYCLGQEARTIQIPPTVQGILAARIDRLSPDDKRLLQAAAVIGNDVPFAQLQAIAELPEAELRRGLTRLQAAEFLYETLFPEREYTFKHALTHDVAYGGVLQKRRRDLHARIVAVIERLYAARLDEQVDRLAHHAIRGELWAEAVRYLRRAGSRGTERSAYREALAFFEQALLALGRLPQTEENVEHALDIRLELRTALLPSGDFARIEKILREAQQLATILKDPIRLRQIVNFSLMTAYIAGDHQRAMDADREAAAWEDLGVQALPHIFIGLNAQALGQHCEAIALFRKAIASLQGGLIRERLGQLLIPAVTARLLLSFSLAEIGRFDEAIMIATEGVEIAQSPEHPVSLAMALWALGQSYLGKGGLSIAVPTLERALQLCRDQQLPLYLHAVTPATGAAYILDGRSSAAVELMESALRNDEKTKLRCWHAMTLVVLSEAVLTKGDARRATYLAERALDVARSHHQRGYEARVQRLLGEIVSRQAPPDVDEASRHYSGALAVATECGMRPLIPHCHLGLGKLYGRTGKRDEAHEHLATAVTMYREMDMGFWLEKAEAELRQPG